MKTILPLLWTVYTLQKLHSILILSTYLVKWSEEGCSAALKGLVKFDMYVFWAFGIINWKRLNTILAYSYKYCDRFGATIFRRL